MNRKRLYLPLFCLVLLVSCGKPAPVSKSDGLNSSLKELGTESPGKVTEVPRSGEGELNILLFGHSFGIDCTEELPALAARAGISNLHIGRFIKGNCSMEEHYSFFLDDSNDKYAECLPGELTFKSVPKTVREAVSQTRWHYVIFQNSLENEGRYETAQPYLDDLVDFVRTTQAREFSREPVIGWNMFWPISKLLEDGSNSLCAYRLSFYNNSSEVMWTAYMSATQELMEDTGIDFIIPSGTAVMNFRASSLNDEDARELTRDGYHMSYGGGRYLVACVWFEKILAPIYGTSVLGNTYRKPNTPVSVSDTKTATALQKMAIAAVENPFEISVIDP